MSEARKMHAEVLAENVSGFLVIANRAALNLVIPDSQIDRFGELRKALKDALHFHGSMCVAYNEEITRRERVIAALKDHNRIAASEGIPREDRQEREEGPDDFTNREGR